MRKHYAVAGIVVAILVAALIVIAGSRSSDDGASAGAHKADAHKAGALPSSQRSVGSSTASPTDYAAVVKLLEARHQRNPADTKTAMDLANAYLMTEQPVKARRLYAKVLEGDPGNETAKVQLALALHAGGRDAQAVSLLNAVLAADPRSQLAHYNLAIIYFSEQKADLARDEWKKAAAIDGTSPVGKSAQNFVDWMEESSGSPHPSATKGD